MFRNCFYKLRFQLDLWGYLFGSIWLQSATIPYIYILFYLIFILKPDLVLNYIRLDGQLNMFLFNFMIGEHIDFCANFANHYFSNANMVSNV